MARLLKKMSPKTLLDGKPNVTAIFGEEGVKVANKRELLYTVIGKANAVKQGETDYGPWQNLVGEFEAVDAKTGESAMAPQAFLPEPMHSMLCEALIQAEESRSETGDDKRKTTTIRSANTVEFGCEVYLVNRPDLAIGYEYEAKPLTDVKPSDSLSHLRSLLPSPDSDSKAPAKPAGGKGSKAA